jgi:hypothetical protein
MAADRFDFSPLLAELLQAVQEMKAAGGDPRRSIADLMALASIAQALRDNSNGPVDPGDLLFSLFSKSAALMALRASRENAAALSMQLITMMMALEAQTALFADAKPTAADLARASLREGFH